MSPGPTKDEQILLWLESNPSRAIAAILDKYGAALYGIIYRLVGREDEAADLLQEASVKFWKNANQYDPRREKLFTWLISIRR